MWVQTRIDAEVRDEVEDRDADRLVNLTYCRAIRVRAVRAAESNAVVGIEPVDDTSNSGDTAEAEPEAPAHRRWEVVATLAAERAAPGLRSSEVLAAVEAEDEARRLFREIRGALLEGRAGIDLSASGAAASGAEGRPGRASRAGGNGRAAKGPAPAAKS